MGKPTIEDLIEALRPFAEYGVVWGSKHDPASTSVWDQDPDNRIAVHGTCDQHRITVGELRKAANLYYSNDGEPITPEQFK